MIPEREAEIRKYSGVLWDRDEMTASLYLDEALDALDAAEADTARLGAALSNLRKFALHEDCPYVQGARSPAVSDGTVPDYGCGTVFVVSVIGLLTLLAICLERGML